MTFNSIEYMLFLPLAVIFFYLFPHRVKSIWLLICSYFFYGCWNSKYLFLILLITLVSFICGLSIETSRHRIKDKKKLPVLILCVGCFICVSILVIYKYLDFFVGVINVCMHIVKVSRTVHRFDIILPVGISFYTFQAIGYIIDVYRKEIKAERNIVRFALYICFFPQLVAGPIEKAKNLLPQLTSDIMFAWKNIEEGIYLLLWGFFLKVVVADRIAVYVDFVFNDYENQLGMRLLVACVLFAIQIYCDFYGYSVIAKGSALLLGIRLIDNFKAPYLSLSIHEFWKRWHVSLTSWFREYVYIPLGGNRVSWIRCQLNILIVFSLSGLWHGAAFKYIIWGGMNGIYQIGGNVFRGKLRDKEEHFSKLKGINTLLKCVFTFILVDITWVFFRANSTKDAMNILKYVISLKTYSKIIDGTIFMCGLGVKEFFVMILSIAVVLCVDWISQRGIKVRHLLMELNPITKAFVFAIVVNMILLFGKWGGGYNGANFVYFQF